MHTYSYSESGDAGNEVRKANEGEKRLFEMRSWLQKDCLSFLISFGKASDNPENPSMREYQRLFAEIFDGGNFEINNGGISTAERVYKNLTAIQTAFFNSIANKLKDYLLASGKIKNAEEFTGKKYNQALKIFLLESLEDVQQINKPRTIAESTETRAMSQIDTFELPN